MPQADCPADDPWDWVATADAAVLAAALLALVANVALWAWRRENYYDRSARILAEEMGPHHVQYILERELARLFAHYTEAAPAAKDESESSWSETEETGSEGSAEELSAEASETEASESLGETSGSSSEAPSESDDDSADGLSRSEPSEDEAPRRKSAGTGPRARAGSGRRASARPPAEARRKTARPRNRRPSSRAQRRAGAPRAGASARARAGREGSPEPAKMSIIEDYHEVGAPGRSEASRPPTASID